MAALHILLGRHEGYGWLRLAFILRLRKQTCASFRAKDCLSRNNVLFPLIEAARQDQLNCRMVERKASMRLVFQYVPSSV